MSTLSDIKKQVNDSISNKKTDDTIKLSNSRGKATTVHINKNHREIFFTADDMITMQSNHNLSQRTTLSLANTIRKSTRNRCAIEKNLKRKLSEKIHTLDDFFKIKNFDFESGKNNITSTRKGSICCNDLDGLIEFVTKKRGLSIFNCVFGIDGGGGFLKLCLTIQSPPEMDSDNVPCRQTYDDGIVAKRFCDAGVKKLLIIGIVSACKETYNNINMLCSDIYIRHL